MALPPWLGTPTDLRPLSCHGVEEESKTEPTRSDREVLADKAR